MEHFTSKVQKASGFYTLTKLTSARGDTILCLGSATKSYKDTNAINEKGRVDARKLGYEAILFFCNERYFVMSMERFMYMVDVEGIGLRGKQQPFRVVSIKLMEEYGDEIRVTPESEVPTRLQDEVVTVPFGPVGRVAEHLATKLGENKNFTNPTVARLVAAVKKAGYTSVKLTHSEFILEE